MERFNALGMGQTVTPYQNAIGYSHHPSCDASRADDNDVMRQTYSSSRSDTKHAFGDLKAAQIINSGQMTNRTMRSGYTDYAE